MLTLQEIAENPQNFTQDIRKTEDEGFVFRPLMHSDTDKLARFLEGLSAETRRLSSFDGYDLETAKALCDAIARYDKLRFVVELNSDRLVGLLEFSFAIMESDISRYLAQAIILNPETDCRFGITLADAYQNKGLGSLIMPMMNAIARKFERQRLILWGGVLADNARAIRFYEKNGFQMVGKFENSDGIEAVDMLLEL